MKFASPDISRMTRGCPPGVLLPAPKPVLKLAFPTVVALNVPAPEMTRFVSVFAAALGAMPMLNEPVRLYEAPEAIVMTLFVAVSVRTFIDVAETVLLMFNVLAFSDPTVLDVALPRTTLPSDSDPAPLTL